MERRNVHHRLRISRVSPKVNIYEGETSAQQLLRLLNENGYVGYYGGSVSSSFYLAYVADGTASAARYNNYQRSSSASSPKALGISPTIPSVLVPHLKSTMTFYDPGDYEKNWKGHLGEFVITNGSGWMYSVNNVFPNVGFADTYLSDGDIVRVQFTLGYGADIGGFGAMGTSIPNVENQPKSGYFSVANKDSLTKAIERTIYSGLITRSNVKMHTPRHYPLPRRLTLRKVRSITRFPLSIRHFKIRGRKQTPLLRMLLCPSAAAALMCPPVRH